jgi:hypothetical protein
MPIDENILARVIAKLRGTNPNSPTFRDTAENIIEGFDVYEAAELQDYVARVRAALQAAPSQAVRPASNRAASAPIEVPVSAPYRFVALNAKVAPAQTVVTEHGLDRPLPGGFCGSVTVEWAAETPLLIGTHANGIDAPLRIGEHYAIPGATLRGAMRAACESIGYGRLFQVNRHHRYAVRDFTHELFQNEPVQWPDLGAGWLSRVPDFAAARQRGESGYTITPCAKYLIRIRALPWRKATETEGDFHLRWLKLSLSDRHAEAKQRERGGRSPLFDFERPRWRFSADPHSADRVVYDRNGNIEGVMVFAGRSPSLRDLTAAELNSQEANPQPGNQKKFEYVFVDRATVEPVKLTPGAFQRFEFAHSKPSKNKRAPEGSFADLFPTLASGKRIPVFYIGGLDQQDAPSFAIGLTRLFKRPHRASVGDVLLRETAHNPVGRDGFTPDMVEGLFGYVYEPDELGLKPSDDTAPRDIARKGRVAFGFATATGEGKISAQINTVMMGPRASFGPFYLRNQTGQKKDWSDSNARLAGRKRYFPRFADLTSPVNRQAAATAIYTTLGSWHGNGTAEIESHLKYLESAIPETELAFRGDIRLHNVSGAELGMLLWALSHGGDPTKPYRHMLGRGKAAGAGQVRVKSLHLKLVGNDEAAQAMLTSPEAWEVRTAAEERWTAADGQSLAPFLRAFEQAMQSVERTWPRTPPVLEWLGTADVTLGQREPAARTGYLPLNAFREVRRQAKDGPERLLPAQEVPANRVNLPYRR